jgi:SAM-dependent methyltransferase
MRRTAFQTFIDTITFPIRSLILFEKDKWGLSSLATERYEYVARQVKGYCLDVGCGRWNRFVTEFLAGNGKGIDVFPYDGLSKENIIEDMTKFPFNNETFDTVTFIANMNHIPKDKRDLELAEAYRVLKPNGNIIVTMGNPLAEIAVHLLVDVYAAFLGKKHEMDTERGMQEHEEYYVRDAEIIERLERAGFTNIHKTYFATQWLLNHQFIGWKTR